MTARPPRATTKGEARRARPRGATHGERAERDDPRRAVTSVPTERFERIGEADAVLVGLPGGEPLIEAALVHAMRDIDLATEASDDRFVVMPYTDRVVGAEVARRILTAVAGGDPVVAGGRAFPPRVTGAVTAAGPGEPLELARLVEDVTLLLEQTEVTGASRAVAS